jgi:hypothetical protein
VSVGPYEQSLRDRAITARRNLVGKVSVDVIKRIALVAATPVKRRGPSPQPIEPPYLPEEAPAPSPQLGSARIIKEVSLKHGVSVDEILSDIRSVGIVAARFEAMYRIREERRLSWAQIGRQFNRDHTSVLHGYRQHKKRLEADA